MNILYMHTHDSGRYIQPYGYAVSTPNLQQLAEEGTLFRHCYCAGPTCSPSRAGLLTGMSAHSSGMIGLAHRGFGLKDYSRHLARFLSSNGYETALCGVQHEASWKRRNELGYEKILEKPNPDKDKGFAASDLFNANQAAEYLLDKKDRKGKPFFLSFGMINTHRDYPEVAQDINPNYVIPPLPMLDTADNRKDFAAFMTAVRSVDKCAGIVLDALKQSGMEDDTIVIFTTDHGISFPKMKCNLYDTGIGVSLIMKFAGSKRKGVALDTLVSQIDVFPTLCDMLGLEKPDWLEGNSIKPVLDGETDKIRDEIFSEVTYHAAYEPMRCIRTERYKLIKYYDNHNSYVPANIDDSISKSFYVDHGYLDARRDMEELFDLYLDPMERVNLVCDERYGEVYKNLSARLEKWMSETNDPLLKGGKVPKPEGATANKVTCMSPGSENPEDYE